MPRVATENTDETAATPTDWLDLGLQRGTSDVLLGIGGLLGELGADVIKVETAQGDPVRQQGLHARPGGQDLDRADATRGGITLVRGAGVATQFRDRTRDRSQAKHCYRVPRAVGDQCRPSVDRGPVAARASARLEERQAGVALAAVGQDHGDPLALRFGP